MRRLYDAIETSVAELSEPMLKDRIAELKATRDQARLDLERTGPAITPQSMRVFARAARKGMQTESGGYRRDHLHALAQRGGRERSSHY